MEENLPTIIQGKPVDSKEEARTAIALEILGWRYVYQRSYFGGSQRPGGIIVDFLVLTPINPTPILVQSRYWHTIRDRRDSDQLSIGKLASLPNLANPIEVWDYQLQTIEQAVRTLRSKIGVG